MLLLVIDEGVLVYKLTEGMIDVRVDGSTPPAAW